MGWYKEPEDGKPKAIHYTEGGPWFKNYRNCEYGDVWKQYLNQMMNNKGEAIKKGKKANFSFLYKPGAINRQI